MKSWQKDFIEFGKRLRRLRQAKELTAVEVAQSLNVPATTYREWENGRAIRGLPYVTLAQILQVGLIELMTGIKSEKHTIFEDLKGIESQMVKLRQSLESLF